MRTKRLEGGAMNDRDWQPWTGRELQRLATFLRHGVTYAEAASELGRTRMACWQKASKCGFRRSDTERERFARRLRELAARGWGNARIGRALGSSGNAIRRARKRLGLPPGPRDPDRTVYRAAHRRVLKMLDADSLVQIRHGRGRLEAITAGWPVGATARDAEVLAALEGGPLTYAGLSARVGWAFRPGKFSSVYHWSRVMSARGWVVKSGRPRVVALSPAVAARRADVLRQRKEGLIA